MRRNSSHILLAYAGKTTTADIMVRLMKELVKGRSVMLRTKEGCKVEKNDIAWADCIVIVRGADLFLSAIISSAKKAGKYCIFYLDDDLLSLYDEKDVYHKYLLTCLENADLLWASSANVIERYRFFLKPQARTAVAVVIDPWENIEKYKRSSEGVGIVFAGSPGHEQNLKKYIIPALRTVHERHKDIRAFFIGFKDTSIDGIDPYIKTTGWFDEVEDYRRFVAQANVQIGLAVIEDNKFGNCKFYNKYLEYTKLGVVGIYSNCEPYTLAVEDRTNGLLAENTVESWTNQIMYAVENPKIREICVLNSQTDLKKNYSTEVIINNIISTIPELMKYRAQNAAVEYSHWVILLRGKLDRYVTYLYRPQRFIDKFKGRN